MKYLILLTSLVSTYSIVAMEKEISTNIADYLPSTFVMTTTPEKPSITIINNDPYASLYIDINANGEGCSLKLLPTREVPLCPYLESQLRNPTTIQNGTSIKLRLHTNRLHGFIPYIDDQPAIKIINGYFGDYIKYKNKVYSIERSKKIDNGFALLCLSPDKDNFKNFFLHIDGTASIKSGDTIKVDYDAKNEEIKIIHTNTMTLLKSLHVTNNTLTFDNTELTQ